MQDSFSNRQNSQYLFVKELTTRRIRKLGSLNTQVCRIFLSVVTGNGKRGNLFNTLCRNSTYFHTYDNDLLRRKHTHARLPTEDKVAAFGWIFCRVLARRRTHTTTPKQNLPSISTKESIFHRTATMTIQIIACLMLLLLATNIAVTSADEFFDPYDGIDFYFPDIDLCDNQEDPNGEPILGPCDHSKFPTCEEGKSTKCYNRKPSRSEFYDDNHQPVFYIQYDRILCYPNKWDGCSSCTPGRYCRSEQRCILEEIDYPCVQWL